MLTGRYFILVEDDALMGSSLVQRLELEGAEVSWLRLAMRGIGAIRTPRRRVDAAICDIRLPDGTGEDIFTAVAQTPAPPPFMFITGQGDIEQAVRLLRAGAADYLTKPFEMGAFLERLVAMLPPEQHELMSPQTGISAAARQVDAQAAAMAKHDRPVLITAQRGLGKARLAKLIHQLSDRSAAPFVTINAYRAEPDGGTLRQKIAETGEGTLLLSGATRLQPGCQAHLMKALRERPLFRLVVSGEVDMDEDAALGRLREDLFYLLAAERIVIPPLGQRGQDAVWLATQMFHRLNLRRDRPLKGISDIAVRAIRDHDWPGNGRELRARLLRAVPGAAGEWLFPADIFPELAEDGATIATLAEARENAERQQIARALARTEGRITQAAQLLQISRTTLWEKMQKLDLHDGDHVRKSER